MERRAVVVGGGVSGLTTALVLRRAGWDVHLIAARWSRQIVSGVAGAVWMPYQVAHANNVRWAQESEAVFRQLAATHPTLVRLVEVREFQRRPGPSAAGSGPHDGLASLSPEELPDGYRSGYSYRVPLIETTRYLAWLRDTFHREGGTLEQRELPSLDEIAGDWPLVVNATGLAARELVGDESLFPIRGQIVRIAPGLTDRFIFNDDDDPEWPIYLIPRDAGTVVGGTALRGDWSLEPRAETTERILERADRLVPGVRDALRFEVRVGLRPGRPTIRLEAEPRGSGLLIHNYGHGGAGFALSWGCAAEVLRLATDAEKEEDG